MATKPRTGDDGQWTTVSEEQAASVVMDTPGDIFEGEYLGVEHITPENHDPFDRLVFRGTDGELYALPTSYQLTKTFASIAEGTFCRITLVKEIDTGKGLNPMKDYRVQTRL